MCVRHTSPGRLHSHPNDPEHEIYRPAQPSRAAERVAVRGADDVQAVPEPLRDSASALSSLSDALRLAKSRAGRRGRGAPCFALAGTVDAQRVRAR